MTDKEVIQMALVQMGINQYSVAELAPHKVVMAFNSAMEVLRAQLEQPEQEPTCPECKAAVLYECVACSSNNYPPAAQLEQEPVAYYHPHKGFYWAKPTHILTPTIVDVPPVHLYVKWKAAQPSIVQERTDYAVHLNHCNIGEFEGVCKYMDDDCPALKHADTKAKRDRPTPPAAQPEQEPVAWIQPDHLQKARRAPFLCRVEPTKRMSDFVPLYATPPAVQRKPLTDAKIKEIASTPAAIPGSYVHAFARAIEAAHGIKEQP